MSGFECAEGRGVNKFQRIVKLRRGQLTTRIEANY